MAVEFNICKQAHLTAAGCICGIFDHRAVHDLPKPGLAAHKLSTSVTVG